MKIQDIDLTQFSEEDLRTLSSKIHFILVQRRNIKIATISQKINVGDIVTINHEKVRDELFRIIKMNPKKVKVVSTTRSWVQYTVPYVLIMPRVQSLDDFLSLPSH